MERMWHLPDGRVAKTAILHAAARVVRGSSLAASRDGMKYPEFALRSNTTLPGNRRRTAGVYAVTLLFHAVLLVVLFRTPRPQPVRVGTGGPEVGISAWIPGPTGTTGTTQPKETVQPAKKPAPRMAKLAQKSSNEDVSDAAQPVGTGGSGGVQGAGSGPIRLGSGGNLTLLNKVKPVYPPMLERARVAGTVVLDAIIHRDGTIGDVTVLKSSNGEFARSAMEAVKQWRYTPIPFEGIVTVTVNFTLP
jgi:TonB family protein